jgi:hypothetical protein
MLAPTCFSPYCAFVGQKNFDIIEMHGTTIKIISNNLVP